MSEKFNQLVETYLEKTKKECYVIEPLDGIPNITDDKIGGIPYLPIGESIPTDSTGKPMELLLQVDLSKIQLENFNFNGILQAYIEQELPYPITYKIKVYQPNLPYQENLIVTVSDESPISEPFKIKLKKVNTYMSVSDFRAETIILNLVEEIYGQKVESIFDMKDENSPSIEKFWGVIADKTPSANIGGYPDFTQIDPREYGEHEEKTECLFKIDSNLEESKIMFGDAGIMFALISVEDLRNNNLDNTFVDWDCG